jgi:hypothetical protein
MTNYELIKSFQNPKREDHTPLPKGVKYEQRTVVIEGSEHLYHIPQKEIDKFDRYINENKKINRTIINEILRKVRGIRG